MATLGANKESYVNAQNIYYKSNEYYKMKPHGLILKAPPVNPRVYIYQYYNIDPKEGLKYVRIYV